MVLGWFVSGFRDGFKSFGLGVTNVVNAILLSLAYFLAVALTSVAARASKKEFLDISPSAGTSNGEEDAIPKESYWEDLNLYKKDIKEYYRQY